MHKYKYDDRNSVTSRAISYLLLAAHFICNPRSLPKSDPDVGPAERDARKTAQRAREAGQPPLGAKAGNTLNARVVRVLIADDHELFLDGLAELISKAPDMEVAGLARDGLEALQQTEMINPDVVLIDVTMPHLNGINAASQIREKFPDVRMLVLSMHGDREFIVESLKAGAHGYVLKECAVDELYLAIRTVMKGHYYLTPSVLPVVIDDYLRLLNAEDNSSSCPLSDRELGVLKLLVKGLNTKQTAELLAISKNTVDTHRRRIMDKLGCNSMAELTRYAIREGYLDLG